MKKIHVVNSPLDMKRLVKMDDKEEEDKEQQEPKLQNATESSSNQSCDPSKNNCSLEEKEKEEEEPQMPWRTNLRKTNSKLSLLE